jgi:UDP-2-acetamido-3-amino-2,3-dideoxy-glucuronate N-acetyltransferase
MTTVAITTKKYFVHPDAIVETEDIGTGTRVWAFAHVMQGARVGADCNICNSAFIETGSVLGNNVTVKNGVAVWQGVTVEDNVFLGPNCVLTNDPNPRAYIKKHGIELQPTLIRANATIGANATILCGLTIGQYAFVGAGAVIIKSVPDFALMVGNPSRQIGWMCVCGQRLKFKPSESVDDVIRCAHCNRYFQEIPTGLSIVDKEVR